VLARAADVAGRDGGDDGGGEGIAAVVAAMLIVGVAGGACLS